MLRFKVGLLLASASAGALAATAALAETTPADVSEVVVTGSHLQVGGFTAPTPVTQVGADQFKQRAASSVFEVIRDIPTFKGTSGPSVNSTGAQSASKANLDLRGLGSVRTLVLVNGRRHVPDAPTAVFDTNLIPTSLIERVDIVTGGASAAYGSDAVAGVVNFILKNHLEGFTADMRFGVSQRGDNQEYNPSFAFGHSFMGGRGHFIIGGDYTDSQGTGNMYARSWGQLEPGAMSLPANRAAGLPATLILNHVETAAYNASGLITSGPLKGLAFGENGTTYPFQYGSIVGGTEMIGSGNYGSVENPDQFLRAQYKRGAALTRVEYEFTPSLVAFAQLQYGVLHTYGRSFGARVPNFNNYTVQIDNPFLPPSVVAAMKKAGVNKFTYSATRHDDLGSIASRNRTETLQFDTGIKGEIFGDWKWDIGGGAGKATFAPDIHNTPREADFYHSAYVVTGPDGKPMCGPVATDPYFNAQNAIVKARLIANLSPGCVPYNIFGTNTSQNLGALAYFNSASQADMEFRQYDVAANIAGAPFHLPAGDVSVAAGLEWRRDTADVVNCPDCQKLALMNQNYSLYTGAINVKEIYGEVGVPVFRDMPFAKSLDLNGAARRTDYSTSGAVTTWKVGGVWDVTDFLRFRATRSRDIRAPNINELFNPGSEGNPNVVNRATGASGFTKSNTVGNPNLIPETGDTTTGGVVFQPQWGWSRGLRVSVDYWNIKIRDVISTQNVQDILDAVLLKHDPVLSQFVVLDPSSPVGVSRVNVPQQNLNALKTHGFDVEVAYAVPMEDLNLPGQLTLRALGSRIAKYRTITPTTDIDSSGLAGTPTWSWNGQASYREGPFTGTLTVRYTSKIRFSATAVGLDGLTPGTPEYLATAALSNSVNQNIWPEATYWYANLQYAVIDRPDRKVQAYVTVDNLFDKQPPIVAVSINGSAYDLIGRSFKFGVRVSY
ncbi:MAG: TonB-dependent receptor [Caulobacterales bacterium]|nr:TonB-dependent receptor [Caulobacterales bacterium]